MLTPSNDTTKAGLIKLAELYNMPDFVKQAEMEVLTREELSALPKETFADGSSRQYPCHTKTATWLSAAYALANYENIPRHERGYLFDNLEKKASFFKILPEYYALLNTEAAREKAAEVKKSPDGNMDTIDEIEKAAEWVEQNKNKLPLYKRAEAASTILKQASALHANLKNQASLERMVGKGVNEFDDVMAALRSRTALTKHADYAASLNKYLDRIEQMRPTPFDKVWYKVACVVDDFDYLSGLMPMRERGELAPPEEVVFSDSLSNIKKAEDSSVRLINGDVYELEKLAAIAKQEYKRLVGDELTDQLFPLNSFDKEAASDILPTLPRTDADAFRELVKEAGVQPMMKFKAAGYELPADMVRDAMNYYY